MCWVICQDRIFYNDLNSTREQKALQAEIDNPLKDGSAYYDYMEKGEEYEYEIFCELFDHALREAARVYEKHRATKDDSWQQMRPDELRLSLHETMRKWHPDTPLEYGILLDVINVALMLVTKLAQNSEGR